MAVQLCAQEKLMGATWHETAAIHPQTDHIYQDHPTIWVSGHWIGLPNIPIQISSQDTQMVGWSR